MPFPREKDHGWTRGTCLAAVGITLVALAVRLWGIGGESAWSDEVLTLQFLDAPTYSDFYHDSMAGSLPGYWQGAMPERVAPLFFALEYFWSRLFGAHVWSQRLLSALLGTATVGLLYLLGLRLANRRVAGYAALLLALSLSHTYYSQEVRFYAVISFLVTLSMLAYLALAARRKRWWLLHVAANAALLWTHPVSVLLPAAQGFHTLVCHRRESRRCLAWMAAHVALLAAFAGWVWWLGYDLGHDGRAYRPEALDWRDLPNLALILAGGRFGKLDPAPYMWMGLSADRLAALLVGGLSLVPAWYAFRRGQAADSRANVALLYAWCAIPPLLLFLIAVFWRHVFFARYVLYCGPALCLLAGWGLARLPHAPTRRTLAAGLCLLLAWQHAALPRPHRPDYATLTAHLETHAARDAVVLPLKHFNTIPLRFYLEWPTERVPHHQGYGDLLTDAKARVAAGTEVWAVFWLWDRVTDFADQMRAAGARPETLLFGGMPPLQVVHVPASRQP